MLKLEYILQQIFGDFLYATKDILKSLGACLFAYNT